MTIVDRLRFDSVRCEMQFSKGIAQNIEEAADEIERLRAALEEITRECDAMNKGPVAVRIAKRALEQKPDAT